MFLITVIYEATELITIMFCVVSLFCCK